MAMGCREGKSHFSGAKSQARWPVGSTTRGREFFCLLKCELKCQLREGGRTRALCPAQASPFLFLCGQGTERGGLQPRLRRGALGHVQPARQMDRAVARPSLWRQGWGARSRLLFLSQMLRGTHISQEGSRKWALEMSRVLPLPLTCARGRPGARTRHPTQGVPTAEQGVLPFCLYGPQCPAWYLA